MKKIPEPLEPISKPAPTLLFDEVEKIKFTIMNISGSENFIMIYSGSGLLNVPANSGTGLSPTTDSLNIRLRSFFSRFKYQ